MTNDEARVPNSKRLFVRADVTIDDKGRIAFPKSIRERIGSKFVMTLGAAGCIEAMHQDTFEERLNFVMARNSLNPAASQYKRLTLAYTDDECTFDPQGRALIPAKLRDASKLRNADNPKATVEAVLSGLGDVVEIWNRDEFARFEKDPDDFDQRRIESVTAAYHRMQAE